MSGREWKPGDVAMITTTTGRTLVAVRDAEGGGWNGLLTLEWNLDRHVTEARRLLVIDPEDREQVDTFAKALVEAMYAAGDHASAASGVHPATVANALRSLITPPKPPEPTGLGAVVIDAKSDHWVLINVPGVRLKPTRTWRTWWGSREWSEITAVKVLSEGDFLSGSLTWGWQCFRCRDEETGFGSATTAGEGRDQHASLDCTSTPPADDTEGRDGL